MKRIKITLFALTLVFATALFAGCSSGSSGGGSASDTGAFSMSVSWPNQEDRAVDSAKLIPDSSSTISVSITGQFIDSPITSSITNSETTLTINNVPVGSNVATIKAFDSSGGLTAERKESFVVNEGQTTTSDNVPLGMAINESGVLEPGNFYLFSGQTVYVQNWSASQVTVSGLGSDTPLAPPAADSGNKITFSQMTYSPASMATVTGTGVSNTANVILNGGFSDDFSGSALNPGWTSLIQDSSTIALNGSGQANITSKGSSDIWSDTNYKAPRIYQKCSGDWTVETKLSGTFTTDFQGSGIFIQFDENDPSSIIRIFERTNSGLVHGTDPVNKTTWGEYSTSASNNYMRLVKQGTTYRQFYSADGTNWINTGVWTRSGSPCYVGLFSISSLNATQTSANFDYFNYTPQSTILTGGFGDEFNGSTLYSGWTSLIQDSSTISLDGSGLLNVKAVNGADMWPGNYKAPRIYQTCTGNWTVETKLTGSFNQSYQGSGIFIQLNSSNQSSIVRILQRSNGNTVEGIYPANSSAAFGQTTGVSATTLYLRVQKSGTTYNRWFSTDGSTWTNTGSWTWTSSTPCYVGLFCISSVDSTQNSTNFEYFHYTQQ